MRVPPLQILAQHPHRSKPDRRQPRRRDARLEAGEGWYVVPFLIEVTPEVILRIPVTDAGYPPPSEP
ncbi:MAG: hypothetical protein AB1758_19605 [Candidatus Eremiobacterota bacterium]